MHCLAMTSIFGGHGKSPGVFSFEHLLSLLGLVNASPFTHKLNSSYESIEHGKLCTGI